LFKPKKKQRKRGSNAEKQVLDYQHGERNLKDMKKFLEYQIPNYVERVKFGRQDYDKIYAKASKYGLPMALFFTSKATTSNSVKWLSTEYRRRILMVEIPPTTKNVNLRTEIIGGDDSSVPALYIVPTNSNNDDPTQIITYEGDDFKRRKLQDFFNENALKEPVFEPIANMTKTEDDGDSTKVNAEEENETSKNKKKESVGGDEF